MVYAFVPTSNNSILAFTGTPGIATDRYALVWDNGTQSFTLGLPAVTGPDQFSGVLPVSKGGTGTNNGSLSKTGPLTFSTGGSTSTIRERARIHPNGATIYSSDGIGAFVVASFAKDAIPRNTVTPLAKFIARNNSVYGLVHAYFSLNDIANNLYLAERVYRLFWNGATLLFAEVSNLGFSAVPMPNFSVTVTENTVTLSGTFNSYTDQGWSISMAFQWIPYGYDLADLSIEKA